MLGQEAVIAEQLTSLVIIFLINKSRVALVAGEALVMPVSLSIKHHVLHIDWQLTSLAVLCHRLRLDIVTPDQEEGLEEHQTFLPALHCNLDTLLALQPIFCQQKFSLFITQGQIAYLTLKALLVESLISKLESL